MKFILKLFLNTIAVAIVCYLQQGVSVNGSIYNAIIVVCILALANTFIKPVLVILTLPITIFSLGFFLLVINALMVLLVDYLVPGFKVNGFGSAMIFSLLLTLINYFLEKLFQTKEDDKS